MIDLFCKIYLDTESSIDDVNRLILASIGGDSSRNSTITTSSCLIDIDENDQFDEVMRTDPVNGFLYCRYFLDIEPVEGVSRVRYVEVLSTLLKKLREKGCKAIPACDFEDELPPP